MLSRDDYYIREFIAEDAIVVANNMRPQDRQEVWAWGHYEPLEAILFSALGSRDTCFTGVALGEPVCVFGVKPPDLLGTTACPWMLGSTKLNFYSRTFLRESKHVVQALAQEYPEMENWVDARNTAAIRWLQWVGFSVYYPEVYGRDKMLFHRFDMRG